MTEDQFSILSEKLDQIYATLNPSEAPDALLSALASTYGNNGFTSAEAWAAAQAAAQEAEMLGQRLPDLPHELQRAAISTTHGLGRYLGGCEGRGVSKIGEVREGILWQLDPAVSRGDETAKAVIKRA